MAIKLKQKGSILAYSLIIIATMLAIASSLSVSSVIEKKAASGTEFSTQSLQTADSGAQLALKKINAELALPSPRSIASALNANGVCVGSKFTSSDGAAGPTGSVYELTFLRADGITQLACTEAVSLIANIKSVGTYRNTVRAVDVAVNAEDEVCPATVSDNDTPANVYPVVKIGTECWMAANLRTTKKPDGTSLIEGGGMYSNPAGYDMPWGRHYSWSTAMNISPIFDTLVFDYSTLGLGYPANGTTGMKIRGICPTDWHIPSDYNRDASDDFQKLLINGGGSSLAGGAVKEIETTNWSSPNTGANNSTGFTALPAGFYTPSTTTYGGRPGGANFRSSYSVNATQANCYSLINASAAFFTCNSGKALGFSVRCVKD